MHRDRPTHQAKKRFGSVVLANQGSGGYSSGRLLLSRTVEAASRFDSKLPSLSFTDVEACVHSCEREESFQFLKITDATFLSFSFIWIDLLR